MDDRSYRDGCPPYCTCVDCANKQFNKNSGSSFFSTKIIFSIGLFISTLIVIILIF